MSANRRRDRPSAAQGEARAPRSLRAAVRRTLDHYAEHGDGRAEQEFCDPGPLVLAALAAEHYRERIHDRVVERWLEKLNETLRTGTLEFGPTGPLSGLAFAARVVPRLRRLSESIWEQVADALPSDCWRSSDVRWSDYDLIRGPSGMLLSLVAAEPPSAAGAATRLRLAKRCANQLMSLCEDEGLSSFRLEKDQEDDRLTWGEGRINTGVAHGVAGVALALEAAVDHGMAPPKKGSRALTRIAEWLVSQSCVDRAGRRTWPLAGLDGDDPPLEAPGPQAWCYGTPGIAWALWESGRVLARKDIQSRALESIGKWCELVEPVIDLATDPRARLGFCHGIAGMLAIADQFARRVRFDPARRRADVLQRLLIRNLDAISGDTTDSTLLTGTSGILAVLLTREGASDRWTSSFGLG